MPNRSPRPMGRTLALLAFAQLMTALDFYIVFVALPDIGGDLGFSAQTLQWVTSAYAAAFGGFLLLGGRAADLLGRRRMFVLAMALFGVSSLAGGLAASPGVLVAARAVQGLGSALLVPATLALVNTLFEEGPRRNRALAAWSGAGASGLALGSLLGGVLTGGFGWQAVFYVNVPFAALALAAALVLIPADGGRDRARRFDVPGAVLATGGISLLAFALIEGPESGWTAPRIVGAFALAAALLAAFVTVEARGRDPLIPLRLLGNRSLSSAILVILVFGGTFNALPYLLTLYFQTVLGYGALTTGLAFLLPSLLIAAGTQFGGRLATRVGMRATLLTGILGGAAGTGLLAFGIGDGGSYWQVVPGIVVMGVSQGLTWTGMWIASATGVAHEEQGIASGIAYTALQIGGALGLALLIIAGDLGEGSGPVLAGGLRTATLVAAAGMLLSGFVALTFARHRRPEAAQSKSLSRA